MVSKRTATSTSTPATVARICPGLAEKGASLASVEGVSVVRLGEADIVRHPLVAGMLSVL